MRILVTGATGFVGSAVTARLVGAGHEVFCVCRPGSSVPLGQAIMWDAASSIEAAPLPGGIDGVVHLAQARNYRNFPGDSREMFEVNVGATMGLLQWAARTKVQRFCLVSSGTVYEPFDRRLREDAAVSPSSFLGATKLASENIARPFSELFKLSILRLFFPFGPNQADRLIPDLIRRVHSGRAVHVTANGEGMRLTPTFVENVVDVIMESLAASWTGTVNVASPEALSIRQIAEVIGKQLGIQPVLEMVDRKPVDVVPDLTKLASRFPLDRFIRFEDALRLTIRGDFPGAADASSSRAGTR